METTIDDLMKEERDTSVAAELLRQKLNDLKARMEPFGRISYYVSQIYKPRPNLDEQDTRTEAKRTEIAPLEPQKRKRKDIPSL